ncbi:laminin subunit alpha-4 isoform 1-T1 [Synchiropus picturatus]
MVGISVSSFSFLFIHYAIMWTSSAARLGQQRTIPKACAKGFFLSEQDVCLPCNCKGNAENCEDITGVCIDCKNHSTGNFCEMCEEGYILVPGGRPLCQPCSCPLSIASNNFAVHCDQGSGLLRCKCQKGYAGHFCERCAPGYYGNPMSVGNSCKRCDCNGNSDPNLIFNECHNVTGHCEHCWGNTAGPNCERCAPGFYGDAISAKNCRECKCNKCGTTSCDDRTGVCHCKPGATGLLCDQCEEGYSGFSSCQGCRRCECAAASLRSTCHPLTHNCPCRPGAGGRYCERCLPGYWDYSPAGCLKCQCESGHCDMHTGECLLESATVSLCNTTCNECFWILIGDMRVSNKTLDHLRVGMLNISTGAAANDRLKYYNYTAHRLQIQFHGWRNASSSMKVETSRLEEAIEVTGSNMQQLGTSEMVLKALHQQVDDKARQTFTMAEQLTTNLSKLNMQIEEMIHDWELYREQPDVDPEIVQQNTDVAHEKVKRMKTLDLSRQEPMTTNEAAEAHDLLRSVRHLEKKLMITAGRLLPSQEVLSRFTSKLTDAQMFLHTAARKIQENLDQNRVNSMKQQQMQVKQRRWEEDYTAVSETLYSASNLISDVEDTASEISSIVQNVTAVYAALDGATDQLKEKTVRLSLADDDLVRKAVEHAEDLEDQAYKLEEGLRESDANGFVQKAISAANVYSNILKYINDANITSLTTLHSALRTEDAVNAVNLQLGNLVTQSDHVFKESVTLHSEQKDIEAEVKDGLKYIEETRETTEINNKKLSEILTDIQGIQGGRTSQRLQFSINVSEETLNRSTEVLQTITPISSKVQKWITNLHNNEYSSSTFDQVVASAGETVANLNVLVPELLTKLKVVEEKKAVSNATTKIMRIRELIAQARSVAKKVQVSMKFNGQSSVEVHPHYNLEDLKTMTTISLFLRVDPDKDPIEDRFILYLGDKNGRKDYMGLAIKNDNLVFMYNLGGEDVEIYLSSKPVSQWPAVFNYIKVERLGRHGKVYLTIPSQGSTYEQKFIQKGEAVGTDSLFDADPKDLVFFVGGFPPDMKLPPPLSLAPFVGCLELAALNNDVISLYNFKKTLKMDVVASPPCPRYKLAFSESRIASYLFDGSGYALINNMERRGKFGVVTRFDISVRTVANNGVLFLMVHEEKFFLLEMVNGFLRILYDFGFKNGPNLLENNLPKLQINDARYHEVSVIYHQSKKVILLVDKTHVKSMENAKASLPFSDIYIGGAPSHILKSRPELRSVVGLKGCVRGFQFQKKDFNLLEEPGTIGISSGCPEESFMSRKAYFTGESYLGSTAKISPFDNFEVGLNFRTLQPNGLLFYHSKETDEFIISLENGAVVLNTRGTRVKSHKKHYNDGLLHFLVTKINSTKYALVVDDKDKQDKKRPASAAVSSSGSSEEYFYYGGSPTSSLKNLTGCISYAYLSRLGRDIEPEDFQRYTEKVQTSLQDCPLHPPAVALNLGQRGSQRKNRDKASPPVEGLQSDDPEQKDRALTPCYHSSRPKAAQPSFYFSGFSNSRQHYSDLPDSSDPHRFHLSLSLKTLSSSGLVFYISDIHGENIMSLILEHGELLFMFTVGNHTVKIRSTEKYNDAAWHNVDCIRDGRRGRLILDGQLVLEDQAPGVDTSGHVFATLYVGGLPPQKSLRYMQKNSARSFIGCLKNLQLDGRSLLSASEVFGVTPCFDGVSEKGTFFSEEGGFIMLHETMDLGQSFQLQVEVRPRVASGLILHVQQTHTYFTVYIHQGSVWLAVKDESHELVTKVSPLHAPCDGHWHKITVTTDADMLLLDVDSEVSQVEAPLIIKSMANNVLFVGGVPDHFPPKDSVTMNPFVGCMRNLHFNKSHVSFNRAALVSGAVRVGACPAE